MSARCDLSDLPVEMCACRIHGPKDAPREDPIVVGPSFVARFPGRCEACDRGIVEGDLIARSESDGYVHVEPGRCRP